jgi:Tetratricopeptide repeat
MNAVAPGALRLLASAIGFSLLASHLSADQAADATIAYVERGHQTEARQHAYHERMERLHDALAVELRRAAPDLLPKLEPTPPKVFGYGILPRVVPDARRKPVTKPEVVRFSWIWSDTLIARENEALDTFERRFERIRSEPPAATRAAYEALVADYKTRVDRRRPIDADIDYNWLWQKQIAANRPLFDRLQSRLDAELQRLAQGSTTHDEPVIDFDPPLFVRIETPAVREHLITVPIYTDIQDPAIVRSFVTAVESQWRVSKGSESYRVRLTVTVLEPHGLYCGAATVPPCASPAIGEKIDLAGHARRFPEDGAVLTTGAASLQIAANRALVLGPHDVSPRTLAHEFGHLLGLPDTYLRGYRDLGGDGFQVLELVADQSDLMSSIATGSVLQRHFEGVIAAKKIQNEMEAGVSALYQKNDPEEAVTRFRTVLARNPQHFGATLQLAKALNRAGRPGEAVVVWKKMLEMAEAVNNTETAATVRARLAAVQ